MKVGALHKAENSLNSGDSTTVYRVLPNITSNAHWLCQVLKNVGCIMCIIHDKICI